MSKYVIFGAYKKAFLLTVQNNNIIILLYKKSIELCKIVFFIIKAYLGYMPFRYKNYFLYGEEYYEG